MHVHPMAGKLVPRAQLADIPRLVASYYALRPDPSQPEQRVAFGTSGHRGSSLRGSFNEAHILATAQAIAEIRAREGATGPMFLGTDTHALSEPAFISALEVFAANGVEVRIQGDRGYTPTPVVSHAILTYNRDHEGGRADGCIVTPSHNPPEDGGFKYNPPSGGPAGTETTKQIEKLANEILAAEGTGVNRMPYEAALRADTTREIDFVLPYVRDLATVVDLEAVSRSGVRIGVDPMGGSAVGFWGPIAEMYNISIDVVQPNVDPTFSFMTLDWDGKIRMDCSSPYAMAGLIAMRERYDVAFGNDPDSDRHGIVTPDGLMNPNHYLAVAIDYLFRRRTGWSKGAAVGKTLVSSGMIDRVASDLGRTLAEVPVGFKWFVDGLLDGGMGFGGEESAGASFLRMDGSVWTTDKDGILLALLAAEILASTGRSPSACYRDLEQRHGSPVYERIDAPATPAEKTALSRLSPERVAATSLGGSPIVAKLTSAPWNGASIGGLKVVAEDCWFAARPSGTENVTKLYAESFRGSDHLRLVQDEARQIVAEALRSSS